VAFQQDASELEPLASVGGEETVVADLDKSPRQDVLEEAGDEGDRLECHRSQQLGTRVPVGEGDAFVVGVVDAGV
jgi:hypothetical protein